MVLSSIKHPAVFLKTAGCLIEPFNLFEGKEVVWVQLKL